MGKKRKHPEGLASLGATIKIWRRKGPHSVDLKSNTLLMTDKKKKSDSESKYWMNSFWKIWNQLNILPWAWRSLIICNSCMWWNLNILQGWTKQSYSPCNSIQSSIFGLACNFISSCHELHPRLASKAQALFYFSMKWPVSSHFLLG